MCCNVFGKSQQIVNHESGIVIGSQLVIDKIVKVYEFFK